MWQFQGRLHTHQLDFFLDGFRIVDNGSAVAHEWGEAIAESIRGVCDRSHQGDAWL
jgi:hypothetical protein